MVYVNIIKLKKLKMNTDYQELSTFSLLVTTLRIN